MGPAFFVRADNFYARVILVLMSYCHSSCGINRYEYDGPGSNLRGTGTEAQAESF